MAERSPLVAALGLAPHVEGGYYRELWRSEVLLPQPLLGEPYSGPRAGASSYFLLHPGEVSSWHVVTSAELWLYHLGSPLTLTLGGGGNVPASQTDYVLGPDVLAGQRPQLVVPPAFGRRPRTAGRSRP